MTNTKTKNCRFQIISFLVQHANDYTDITPLLNAITAEAGYSVAYLLILLEALRKNGLVCFDDATVLHNNYIGMQRIDLPVMARITPGGIEEYRRREKNNCVEE